VAGAVCTVCLHPSLVAIDTAIAAGTPSLRDIARLHPPLTKDSIFRHSQKCVTVRATPTVAKQNKLAAVARRQVEAGTQLAIRDVARTQLGKALTHDEKLEAVWDKVLADLCDETGQIRKIVEVTDDGREIVRVDLLEQLLALSRARVDARGGGSLKWATLAGQLEGELHSGGTTVNVLQMPDVTRLLDMLARALAPWPDAGDAVAQALRGWESGPTAERRRQ
jgi:hypothetical protein